jgi:cell division septal protein FtsQ
MKRIIKISSGIILLLSLMAILLFAFLSTGNYNSRIFRSVEIQGGKYLNAQVYEKFARLEDASELAKLKLSEIKDRLEKHPYIRSASVVYAGSGKVVAKIHEKSFKAILLDKNSQYLIDDELSAVPLLPFTKNIDLPLIENVRNFKSGKSFANSELKKAMKIIYAAELLNPIFCSEISEVDMNNGGEILVRLTSENFVLRLGRKDEIRKLAYFNVIFDKLRQSEANRILDYVDLRFKDEICLGFSRKALYGEGEI